MVTGVDVTATVGNAAPLMCIVSDNPVGTTNSYVWKRPDMSVVLGATLETYEISPVNISDAGMYTCEVTVSDQVNNPHVTSGSDSVDMTLTVASK